LIEIEHEISKNLNFIEKTTTMFRKCQNDATLIKKIGMKNRRYGYAMDTTDKISTAHLTINI